MKKKANMVQSYEVDTKNRNTIGGAMKSNVVSIGSQELSTVRSRAIRKEHEAAERTFAVESYLLGEMSEEEQMCFEQHCMECETCGEAIEAGRIFISNIAPLPEPEPAHSAGWFERLFKTIPTLPWLKPVTLMAALLLPVMGWQRFMIAELSGLHANTIIVASEGEKSAGDRAVRPLTTESATIEITVPANPQFGFYRVEITSGRGLNLTQVLPAPPKDGGHELSVQVRRKTLGTGHFAVAVEGLDLEDSKTGHKFNDGYQFDLK
jgi:hypothetical protein